MTPTRESLKHELLSVVGDFNSGKSPAPEFSGIVSLIDTLKPLSPIPDPVNHIPSVAGSWTSLYASFGAGHSKGKSHQDDSTLALQTFKAFPDIPIRVNDILQEIGILPKTYNNVVFFETIAGSCRGIIVIHGTYEPDAEDSRRFRVVFNSAEIRGLDALDDASFRQSLGLPDDYALKRDFKPAKLYSDVVYLDETTRINIGGMGGVYVLERRLEPAISL
jgi:hypothetical protein